MKEGWVKVRLEDLTERDSPITYGVVKPGDEGKIRFIRGGDISDGRVLVDQLRTITTEVSEQYSRTLLRGGELLICLVGQPGQVAIASENLAGANIARQVGLIRLHPDFNAKFIKYFLQSPDGKESLGIHIGGSVQQVINLGDLRTLEIPLPSSTEQNRIVAILDEAFDGIASAKANAEKNLQNARALFESHLQSVFTQRGEGWVEKPIEDIAEFSQGIQVGLENQSTEMADGLVRFIRIVDYTQKTKDLRFVKDPGRRYWVKESDIVMVRYGTPGLIGRGIAGVIANNLFKISVLDEVILNDYLSFFLRKSEIQNYLASQGSSTMPALTFKQLGKVVINYPSDKNVQEKLVKKIQEMSIEVDRLELIYQQKLQSLENLKKSLLHQAFTGQL